MADVDWAERQEAITEAISLFDAGNHAFGRFYQYLYLRYSGPLPAPDAAPVRAALQEAAISVPQSPDAGALQEFASAVATAYQALAAFLDSAPSLLRTGDILTAPDSFRESLRLLLPYLDQP